jgi:hypothetical protein
MARNFLYHLGEKPEFIRHRKKIRIFCTCRWQIELEIPDKPGEGTRMMENIASGINMMFLLIYHTS